MADMGAGVDVAFEFSPLELAVVDAYALEAAVPREAVILCAMRAGLADMGVVGVPRPRRPARADGADLVDLASKALVPTRLDRGLTPTRFLGWLVSSNHL